jgi:hypothetical protein
MNIACAAFEERRVRLIFRRINRRGGKIVGEQRFGNDLRGTVQRRAKQDRYADRRLQ